MHNNDPQHRLRDGLIALLRALPILGKMLRFSLHLTRPHFSAGVVGVVLNGEGRLLLVKHAFHIERPWGLPGGWVDRGEDPVESLQRELIEEVGVKVDVVSPLLIQRAPGLAPHLDIAYLCRARNDVDQLSLELLDYRWVELSKEKELPPFHQAALHAATTLLETY
ncbi:MAG: NUDIX hydrolase [Chloroflexi bacterium]|nr:NUDIX hydrolase [Chloroflexota bacterium]